jgi:DNA-binding response OmpR family regulator
MKAGFDDYLAKPFSIGTLISMVDKYLGVEID